MYHICSPAGLPFANDPGLQTELGIAALAARNTTWGFIRGLRAGVSQHVVLSADAGCNTTVVTDVIVPDFLPPSFLDVQRLNDQTPVPSTVRSAAAAERLQASGL